MNDITIKQLLQEITLFVEEREWDQFHTPKNLSMNVVREASELMELFIWCNAEESDDVAKANHNDVKHELADVMITLLLLARRCNIDVTQAVIEKIKLIKEKYPIEKSKGNNRKYTQFD